MILLYTATLMRWRTIIVAAALLGSTAVVLAIPTSDPLMCKETQRTQAPLPSLPLSQATSFGARYTFADDVDAVSFRMPDQSIPAAVRGWDGSKWTAWEPLEIEMEFDPLLTESNLVIFPRGTRIVELVSPVELELHPLQVSREPASYSIASHFLTRRPKILARHEWGADERFLTRGPESTRSDSTANSEDKENTAPSPIAKRIVDCKKMQRDFPHEFKAVKTVRTLSDGEKLRWPVQYSPNIELLVVHHTALAVGGDPRPAVERVRALYAYHANSRGWGDIGYNFVIDELGQIYEGRTGGPGVVGGHAYCHNIGTVGVSLLGNFEYEKPTQDQISALQWLLQNLARTYDIDLSSTVTFHGNTTPTVVGHGDLVSTTCPGYYMREVMPQVRNNVNSGKITAHVTFPQPSLTYKDGTDTRKAKRLANRPAPPKATEGVTPLGSTLLRGRPGSQIAISIRYQAGETPRKTNDAVAQIRRSKEDIGVWQDHNGEFVRLRDAVTLRTPVPALGTTQLRLKIQFPADGGKSTLTLGGITYILETEGRRMRGA